MDACEIILIRHGETDWNAEGRLQGQAESQLTDVGRAQAAAVAARLRGGELPFAAIYSSDLQRACDSARPIAEACGGLEVLKLPGLRERHLGVLQGLTRKEAVQKQPAAFASYRSGQNESLVIPGGGESEHQFTARVAAALLWIATMNLGRRVVAVSHGGVILSAHRHICGSYPRGAVKNASLNVVRWAGDKWTVVSWGDVAHLGGIGSLANAFGGDVRSA